MRFGGTYRGSSFNELIETDHPHLSMNLRGLSEGGSELSVPHGTTVIAFKYSEGVVVAGDRLATEGHRVASRDVQKVYPTDAHSAVAIAGAAGPAIEMARLLRIELEHYEKIEGVRLSLDGKATYLARMVRQQLQLAIQGLVVVPLFGGFEPYTSTGHVFTFDVVGGRYEEYDFGATGSGSREAKSYLRTVYQENGDKSTAVDHALQALVAAAAQDVATGGPDVRRGIYPSVVTITADGIFDLDEEEVAASAERALEVVR